MSELIYFLKVLHIITAILMAWPLYALVSVNQRALLGPPLGDRVDTYMENIIKNRTIPCFVFQATVLISGSALVFLEGMGLDSLTGNPALALKLLLLILIVGLLFYVHLSLQPRIDALFAKVGGSSLPPEIAQNISALRLRRKRIASICLFSVLTAAMFGVQVWIVFSLWLSGVVILVIALFSWRAYKSVTPYGWV